LHLRSSINQNIKKISNVYYVTSRTKKRLLHTILRHLLNSNVFVYFHTLESLNNKDHTIWHHDHPKRKSKSEMIFSTHLLCVSPRNCVSLRKYVLICFEKFYLKVFLSIRTEQEVLDSNFKIFSMLKLNCLIELN
jgi:hypothetical protein